MQLAGLVAAVHQLVVAYKHMSRCHCYYLPLKPVCTASQPQGHRARDMNAEGVNVVTLGAAAGCDL